MQESAASSARKRLVDTFQIVASALFIITAGKTLLTELFPDNQDWVRWYIFAVVPAIGLLGANVIGVSAKGFLGSNRAAAARRFALALLYFFSLLFVLNLRLVYSFDSEKLLYNLLLNLALSLSGFVLFFIVPSIAHWKPDHPERWPLYPSSFVLGFLPAMVAFGVLVLLGEMSPAAPMFLFLLATGASFTHILGYSHPRNIAYDVFAAKVILLATVGIAILAGILGLGWAMASAVMGDTTLALILMAGVAYWDFIVMLVAIVVVYRYQYQRRCELDRSGSTPTAATPST